MTGYTPLFSSLTTGTLCGRWPDVGLWPIVLSLADRYGVVDVTTAYIAGITGLGIDEVVACMKRFCEPDPYSRSSDEGGARLLLIEPQNRNWGWRIVNYSKYSERARKRAYDERRQASGENAQRLRVARASRHDPTRSDATRDDPLSSQLNSNHRKETKARKTELPEDFGLDSELEEYATSRLPGVDVQALMADYRGKARAKGWKYANWRQAFQDFVRNAMPTSGHFASSQYPRAAASSAQALPLFR
jgi:hypothetical protein